MTQRLQFEHILCPIDFSGTSRLALERAIALARWFGAEVTVVHVAPIVPFVAADPLATVSMASAVETAWQRMKDDLEAFAEPARQAGVAVNTVLLEGDSVHEILELAWTMSTDLIVMGTRGSGGLERWLLGSVTESVLRGAPCPVMTVSRASIPAATPTSRILCPLDLRGHSRETLRLALALAQEHNAALTLLHVVEAPDGPLGVNSHFDVPEYRAYMAQDARNRLRREVPASARNWCDVTEIVSVGEPAREILRVAKEQGSDLIVMGARGPSAVEALFFGSTARRVVRDAACSVLTLPLVGNVRALAGPSRKPHRPAQPRA